VKTGVPSAGLDHAPAPTVRRAVFVFNQYLAAAEPLARRLADLARAIGREARLVSAWDPQLRHCLEGADLAVTCGGDGTILRAARLAAPRGLALLGVNLGRLGFLTELTPEEAERRLPDFLEGRCWVEERDMLTLALGELGPDAGPLEGGALAPEYFALNDVLLGRGERARVVLLNIGVDGAPLAAIRADGLVVATATGSTAYSLSAGGPIVHPHVGAMVLTPILPHLTFLRSLVIPARSSVRVQLCTDHMAMCSVDGQIDIRLNDGAVATIRTAPFPCRFLRARTPTYFYETLLHRLQSC